MGQLLKGNNESQRDYQGDHNRVSSNGFSVDLSNRTQTCKLFFRAWNLLLETVEATVMGPIAAYLS